MSKTVRIKPQYRSQQDLEATLRALGLVFEVGTMLAYFGYAGVKKLLNVGIRIQKGQISHFGDVVFDAQTGELIVDAMDAGRIRKALLPKGPANPFDQSRSIDNPLHLLARKHAEVQIVNYLNRQGVAYRFVPDAAGNGGRFEFTGSTSDGQTGQVTVAIGGDGETSAGVNGVHGPACSELLRPIEEVVGIKTSETLSPAYHQAPPLVASAHVAEQTRVASSWDGNDEQSGW